MLLTKAAAVSLEEAMKMEARNLVAKRRCMIDVVLMIVVVCCSLLLVLCAEV